MQLSANMSSPRDSFKLSHIHSKALSHRSLSLSPTRITRKLAREKERIIVEKGKKAELSFSVERLVLPFRCVFFSRPINFHC